MKHVHKALQLRHHKHTGKLLAHKHTSYGVLFVLMIIPIITLALASHFVSASDYEISAKVPAIPPSIPPTIDYPVDSVPLSEDGTTVSGSCPVASPAVIVAIYDGDVLLGSVQCDSSGNYSLPVTLGEGSHQLVAKIISITGDPGESSSVRTVIVQDITTKQPDSDGTRDELPPIESLASSLRIVPKTVFSTLDNNNETSWAGTFQGGTLPYRVTINWGDGTVNHFEIADNTEHMFAHKYASASTFSITVTLTDATGSTTKLQSVAVTFMLQQTSVLDLRYEQASPIVTFIQSNLVQIYVVSLSGLTFLWYLEHGRNIAWHLMGSGGISGIGKKTHTGRRHR